MRCPGRRRTTWAAATSVAPSARSGRPRAVLPRGNRAEAGGRGTSSDRVPSVRGARGFMGGRAAGADGVKGGQPRHADLLGRGGDRGAAGDFGPARLVVAPLGGDGDASRPPPVVQGGTRRGGGEHTARRGQGVEPRGPHRPLPP